MGNRNKKIIAGSMAAVLLIGASSLAWFSDRTEGSIDGQAGNLCLEMTEIEGDLKKLVPGVNRELSFDYENLGSLSMDTRVTYVLSYELEERTAKRLENDLDVIATLDVADEHLVLKADDKSVSGTFEAGTVKGTKEDVGQDKLTHTLNFKFDESVGNVGQKMKFKLDVIVEGKQNRNDAKWNEVHKTTVKFGDQEFEVVPVSMCNMEETPLSHEDAKFYKYIENDDGTLSIVGLNQSTIPVTEIVAQMLGSEGYSIEDIGKYIDESGTFDVEKAIEDDFFAEGFIMDEAFGKILFETAYHDSIGNLLNDEDFMDSYEIESYTDLTIPDYYDGRKVTKIAPAAFLSLNFQMGGGGGNIESVEIPETITEIGTQAFINNKLTSLVIPNSVTKIGTYAFTDNWLASVEIPDSVTYIGQGAFMNNSITSVDIPDSVTYIGEDTFMSNDLTSVVIPNSVAYIGEHAFMSNKLTSVVIPDSVEVIEDDAFGWNTGGTIYANPINEDAWPNLRGYEFESKWTLKPLSEYKK